MLTLFPVVHNTKTRLSTQARTVDPHVIVCLSLPPAVELDGLFVEFTRHALSCADLNDEMAHQNRALEGDGKR